MTINKIDFKKQTFKWILAFIIDFIILVLVCILYQALIYMKQLLFYILTKIDYKGHIKFWFDFHIIRKYDDITENNLVSINKNSSRYFNTDSEFHVVMRKRLEKINKNNNYTHKE
jgi:hypothetical protein